jgi:hypothetical protein
LKQRQANLDRWHQYDIFVRLIAELGVDLNEMFLDWLKRSRDKIRETL